jgi:hypothetical protein
MKALINRSFLKSQGIAIIAGFVAILLLGAAYWRSSTIAEQEVRWQSMTRQIAVMDANVRHAHGLQEQVEQLEASLQKMETQLFDPDARALNTNFFYQLERDANVRVVQARQGSYQAGSSSSHYATVEFVLVVEGDFASLLGFMQKLYSVNAFIAPNRWDLQPATRRGVDANDASLYTLGLTVRVLARKAT